MLIFYHLVKTKAVDLAIDAIDNIYISGWVYNNEIKKSTAEGKIIEKLKKNGTIKILEYNKLTSAQKNIYNETYKLLKSKDAGTEHDDNVINEGERVTASFAKAVNIYYYMSDDNRAAPHIRSLTDVDIINYCDILFIYLYANNYLANKEEKEKLKECYDRYVKLYDPNKIPRILRNRKTKSINTFIEMMGLCYTKFERIENLNKLLVNIKINKGSEVAVDE